MDPQVAMSLVERSRERNRVHARKSRLRKKVLADALRAEVEALQGELDHWSAVFARHTGVTWEQCLASRHEQPALLRVPPHPEFAADEEGDDADAAGRGDAGSDPEARLARSRERNRIHARKSRLRKKWLLDFLRAQAHALHDDLRRVREILIMRLGPSHPDLQSVPIRLRAPSTDSRLALGVPTPWTAAPATRGAADAPARRPGHAHPHAHPSESGWVPPGQCNCSSGDEGCFHPAGEGERGFAATATASATTVPDGRSRRGLKRELDTPEEDEEDEEDEEVEDDGEDEDEDAADEEFVPGRRQSLETRGPSSRNHNVPKRARPDVGSDTPVVAASATRGSVSNDGAAEILYLLSRLESSSAGRALKIEGAPSGTTAGLFAHSTGVSELPTASPSFLSSSAASSAAPSTAASSTASPPPLPSTTGFSAASSAASTHSSLSHSAPPTSMAALPFQGTMGTMALVHATPSKSNSPIPFASASTGFPASFSHRPEPVAFSVPGPAPTSFPPTASKPSHDAVPLPAHLQGSLPVSAALPSSATAGSTPRFPLPQPPATAHAPHGLAWAPSPPELGQTAGPGSLRGTEGVFEYNPTPTGDAMGYARPSWGPGAAAAPSYPPHHSHLPTSSTPPAPWVLHGGFPYPSPPHADTSRAPVPAQAYGYGHAYPHPYAFAHPHGYGPIPGFPSSSSSSSPPPSSLPHPGMLPGASGAMVPPMHASVPSFSGPMMGPMMGPMGPTSYAMSRHESGFGPAPGWPASPAEAWASGGGGGVYR